MLNNLDTIRELYINQLINGELEFWLKYGMDGINGGIYTALDEDGSIIDTDKSVWFQGRALWVFATAYEKYGDIRYLNACDSLINFIDNHCFDSDGRMFFKVSKVGNPIVKRIRYFFSETFAIIGYATYARITGKEEYNQKSLKLLEFVENLRTTEGLLIPKTMRESKAFGGPMILLNVLSEVKQSNPSQSKELDEYMDKLIEEVKNNFVREDLQLVLEQVGMDGSFQADHFEGRIINPGHAIEASWFIMKMGIDRNNDELINLGLKIYDWMFEEGWDKEFGGIIQYTDALKKPLAEYHQDMKFWWPQCEALIASLYAYKLTKKQIYMDNFIMVNDYIQNHFVDNLNGEWYGYLHKDGTLATKLKGNFYKGPFHIPRMYMICISLIEEINKTK
ncbi:MAG: AGE family epimerase/isomerase [Spirochaetaceae bacterium]|nr:AGE family epimerase/isomerase [Spirochaetaceae bacterium]